MNIITKQLLIVAASLLALTLGPAEAAPRLDDAQGFRLKGVLISPTTRSALVNDKVVKVGDRVAGAEILAIEDGEVLILAGTRKLIVQVGSTAAHGSPAGALLARSERSALSNEDGPPTPAAKHVVRSGDTLSGIAEKYAGNGVRLNQVIAAIFDANPDAFDGNVNRLRAGVVLDIPERAALLRQSSGEAAVMVARHRAEWRGTSPPQDLIAEQRAPIEYGPVSHGETLSGIALRVKDNGVSMRRMMSAIFEANPDAFGDTMDFLREGATLHIPELATGYEGLAAAAR